MGPRQCVHPQLIPVWCESAIVQSSATPHARSDEGRGFRADGKCLSTDLIAPGSIDEAVAVCRTPGVPVAPRGLCDVGRGLPGLPIFSIVPASRLRQCCFECFQPILRALAKPSAVDTIFPAKAGNSVTWIERGPRHQQASRPAVPADLRLWCGGQWTVDKNGNAANRKASASNRPRSNPMQTCASMEQA